VNESIPAERTLSQRGVEITVLSGDTPEASYTLLDYRAPAGFAGVQPHHHRETTEWFFVLSGTMAWTIAGRQGRTGPGGFIEIAPGAQHVWRNASDDQKLHLLVGFDRPGFDAYFRQLFALAAAATEWPPADPTPWIELGRRFDTFA
jgi:mannose-6-phosphate isomerase-like protein (cupin superfamily)